MLTLFPQLLLYKLWCIYLCRMILDPCIHDPISCTNMLPKSNSNENPFVNPSQLTGTYNYDGLNSIKESFVTSLFVYSPIVCKPSCVYCCYCCKCCYKCWKSCGLLKVSIQSSYTSPSRCKCSSPFGNLMSCSLSTSYFSLNCLSYGDVIYGTFHFYSFNCHSCGDVICGTFIVCLGTCTIVSIVDGSTLPFIIFCALDFMLSCSLFTPES
jgi:hypothetical protein